MVSKKKTENGGHKSSKETHHKNVSHKSQDSHKKHETNKKAEKTHAEKTSVKKTNVEKHLEKTPFYKDPLVWVVSIIAIAGVLLLLFNTGSSGLSSVDGQVTLTEYTDYGCPFCSRAYATVEQLKEEYGDKLVVIHKNFPIPQLHPTSPKAHEAAECAKDQGKFYEYRDWLFKNQKSHDVASLKEAAK